MTLEQISKALQKGGASEPLDSGKVLIKEGVTIDEIGTEIQNATQVQQEGLLALVNDENFLK